MVIVIGYLIKGICGCDIIGDNTSIRPLIVMRDYGSIDFLATRVIIVVPCVGPFSNVEVH
jgi:hypothetical protein